MKVKLLNIWILGLLFVTSSVAFGESTHHVQKGGIQHKRLATVMILYQRIRLGMTITAVDRALRDLSFRYPVHVWINAGPEGSAEEIDEYYCSDGAVWLGTEFVSYGKSTADAHVLTVNGWNVNTGWHFIEGNVSAIP